MTKREHARKDWIEATQSLQRLIGNPETSDEELGEEYDSTLGKKTIINTATAIENIEIHMVMHNQAIEAGMVRKN